MCNRAVALFQSFAILLLPPTLQADVGIGAALESNDTTIYVPVRLRSGLMLESYLRYSGRDSEALSTDTVLPPGDTSLKSTTLGIGIFKQTGMRDNLSLYYGGRIGVIRENAQTASLVISSIPINIQQPRQDIEVEGHVVMPAVGLQYFPMERLSIGVEVGLEYTEADSTSVSTDLSGDARTTTIDFTTRDTAASIILRFFF